MYFTLVQAFVESDTLLSAVFQTNKATILRGEIYTRVILRIEFPRFKDLFQRPYRPPHTCCVDHL